MLCQNTEIPTIRLCLSQSIVFKGLMTISNQRTAFPDYTAKQVNLTYASTYRKTLSLNLVLIVMRTKVFSTTQ